MRENVLTISQLTGLIKQKVEEIGLISVQGEISNYKLHSSGHRYFSLKDDNATISCVMWKSSSIEFQPSDGMKVIAQGILTVYPPRGNYQLECQLLSPVGMGDLYLAFEALKKKLKEKGYFDPSAKKSLPSFPTRIGVATSPTGAVIRDIKSTISRRYPGLTLFFRPTMVQGNEASSDIKNAIKELASKKPDVIILARGGGSLEDLWAFNTEIVADAIYNCEIPIISAIGHETDFTISDFVADLRAATPTAAAEIVTPHTLNDLYDFLSNKQNELFEYLQDEIAAKKEMIEDFAGESNKLRLIEKIRIATQRVDDLQTSSERATKNIIALIKQSLAHNEILFKSLHPLQPLKKGFAILKSKDTIITNDYSLANYKEIEIIRDDESATAKINKVFPGNLFN